jgi:hypothetical protein
MVQARSSIALPSAMGMGPVGAGRPLPTAGFFGRLLDAGPPGGAAPLAPRPRPLGVSATRTPAGVSGRETAGEGSGGAATWCGSVTFFFTLPRLAWRGETWVTVWFQSHFNFGAANVLYSRCQSFQCCGSWSATFFTEMDSDPTYYR